MAGLDRMYDARGFIQKYIEEQIRGLLEDPMNEYQDPNWVQAALLFVQVVIPCEAYMMDWFYGLAKDIVNKAEQNNNRVIYQGIPGMYNEKILDPISVDINDLADNAEIRDYEEIINTIKKWREEFKSSSNLRH